jgi:uncharacterized membrane protein YeaQ/YmgE (transglycosylase-associated protein family)
MRLSHDGNANPLAGVVTILVSDMLTSRMISKIGRSAKAAGREWSRYPKWARSVHKPPMPAGLLRRPAKRRYDMNLEPGGLIAWLVVGLIAGWLAGQFMKGGGYGIIGDIVLGIIGAFIGGFVFSLLLPGSSVGLIGSIVVAFVGAVILIALARALTRGRSAV